MCKKITTQRIVILSVYNKNIGNYTENTEKATDYNVTVLGKLANYECCDNIFNSSDLVVSVKNEITG
ncbi:MAG: hypothetical protein MJ149_02580, partial [Clostridia bacterium]|nr:hypothetical protein [Clostridia bacterium]